MLGRVSVVALSICVGACATTGAETSVRSQTATATAAGQNFVGVSGQSAMQTSEFYALEAPGVPPVTVVTPESMADGIVCRRERQTGTKFARHVCRSRAEIEARAEMDQKMWYQLRRNSY
jgi:hypothetical protein